jgi:phage terminase small subunit
MAMNDKQKLFCEEYLTDLNGTQAAIRAGYSEKTANEQAARMLANVSIQNYITELRQKRSERLQYTQDDLLKDLIEVKNRCMQAEPVVFMGQQVKDEEGNNVWKFDSRGANQALDMLAKHNGFYEKDNKQKRELPVITFKGIKI